MMKIERVIVGQLQNNCYIVYDENTREAMIIDPGDEPERIMDVIQANSLSARYIICTHAHFDHIGAVDDIKKETGAKIVIHRDDLGIYASAKNHAFLWGFSIPPPPEPDMFVSNGDVVEAGRLKFTVLHTPGHSPGGICLFGEGVVITGDTVFAGSVGRTDLPGGNIGELKKSFKKIISLPPETKILPGHGDLSTVAEEIELNFFVNEL